MLDEYHVYNLPKIKGQAKPPPPYLWRWGDSGDKIAPPVQSVIRPWMKMIYTDAARAACLDKPNGQ